MKFVTARGNDKQSAQLHEEKKINREPKHQGFSRASKMKKNPTRAARRPKLGVVFNFPLSPRPGLGLILSWPPTEKKIKKIRTT